MRSVLINKEPAKREPGQPWSIPDASAYLGISPETIHRRIREGLLRKIKLGHKTRLPDSEVRRVAEFGFTPQDTPSVQEKTTNGVSVA